VTGHDESGPVAMVLERLKGAKRYGDGHTALCPAHDDANDSLSLEAGVDGGALVKCSAGCSTDAVVAALGLHAADLFGRGEPVPGPSDHAPVVLGVEVRPDEQPRAEEQEATPAPNAEPAAAEPSANTEPGLSDAHRAMLAASGISDDVAKARGYRTIRKKVDLKRLGFADSQLNVPALLVPNFNAVGELAGYQIRPDAPRVVKGRILKYESAKGTPPIVDVPPLAREWVRDPARPLFVTEGARKADAAVSAGLCCIDLPGVWGFRGRNEHGGYTTLPDWACIAIKERKVYVAFDSDVMQKRQVHKALVALAGFLRMKGADVSFIYLPPNSDGSKVGLDDFLAAGKTVTDLVQAARSEPLEPQSEPGDSCEYLVRDGRTYWRKFDAEGNAQEIELFDFTAFIDSEVVRDDGVERQRGLELTCTVRRQEMRCRIGASEFESMGWVIPNLGASAIVNPGLGTRDRARTAIQRLSNDIDQRVVYEHTGWRDIEGIGPCYLHVGGAVGAVGTVRELEVELPDALKHFVLPDPPTGPERIDAVQRLLRLSELAVPRVSYAVLALLARTPIGNSNAAMHISGTTGTFKTETAALVQRAWGTAMDAAHLPGSWSSTGNAVEALLFYAKDVLFTIDDFAPRGSAADIQRFHSLADRTFRSQSNRSARGRMKADGRLARLRAPRGVILSTGEEVPTGESLRARVLIVEISKGDVDVGQLTRCQADAGGGAYARALSAFIQWIASRRTELLALVAAREVQLRDLAAGDMQHRRTPGLVAQLLAGFEVFLTFATDIGAIDAAQAGALREECRKALLELGAEQAEQVACSEPTRAFFQLLGAALVSGEAHVRTVAGDAPPAKIAPHLGWKRDNRPAEGTLCTATPSSVLVGWCEGDDLYLDPTASFKAATKMSGETERLAISQRTLAKRLWERGLLVAREESIQRFTVRVVICGQRRAVLHVRLASLLGPSQPSHPATIAADGPLEADSGTERGDSRADPSATTTVPLSPATEFSGTVGTDGTVVATTDSGDAGDWQDV
jgi:hypothetical protein